MDWMPFVTDMDRQVASCKLCSTCRNNTIEGLWHIIMQKWRENYLIIMSHLSVCYLWSCSSRISEFKSWRQCVPLLPYAPYTGFMHNCILAILSSHHSSVERKTYVVMEWESTTSHCACINYIFTTLIINL